MNIAIPLAIDVANNRLNRCEQVKQSIDSFLDLLLNTPCYSCPSDPLFGFIFTNLRFEIFNENDGVVNNDTSLAEKGDAGRSLYERKISGTSKNSNTFAADLKSAIEQYERRLTDVSVSMSYLREQHNIYITVKGIIEESNTDYQYTTTLTIWR